MRFFFYGTLMEPEILQAVLRRPVSPIRRRKAVLKGYRRVYRLGASYPVLVADTTAQVDGLVVLGLSNHDVTLLAMYEGREYEIRELSVGWSGTSRVRASVFLPSPECEASSESWTPEGWNRRFVKHLRGGRREARRVPARC